MPVNLQSQGWRKDAPRFDILYLKAPVIDQIYCN